MRIESSVCKVIGCSRVKEPVCAYLNHGGDIHNIDLRSRDVRVVGNIMSCCCLNCVLMNKHIRIK